MGTGQHAKAAVLIAAAALLAAAPASAEPKGAAPAKPVPSACDRAAFRAVLDVGHTAESPGARSARGVGEYDFNLGLAKVIDQKLTASGFGKTVLLITDGPTRKGLATRVARANGLTADLFLSIHHDSVPDSFLQKWEHEGEMRGYSDRFKGHSIFISNDGHDYKGSLLFAKQLGLGLKARGLEFTRHYTEKFMRSRQRVLVDAEAGVYRYDQLIVLRATRMPAVLLEAGSIINRDEELAMATPERRALIADAAVEAVEAFCAARKPEPAAPAKQQQARPRSRRQ